MSFADNHRLLMKHVAKYPYVGWVPRNPANNFRDGGSRGEYVNRAVSPDILVFMFATKEVQQRCLHVFGNDFQHGWPPGFEPTKGKPDYSAITRAIIGRG